MSEWIEIREKFPEQGQRVLVCLTSGDPLVKIVEDQEREVRHAKFMHLSAPRFFLYGYDQKTGWRPPEEFSHWMSMPELPIEEEKY